MGFDFFGGAIIMGSMAQSNKKKPKAKKVPSNGVSKPADEQPVSEADLDAAVDAEESLEGLVSQESAAVPEQDVSAESIVEAILFTTDSPVPAPKIAQILGSGNATDIKSHIERLNEHYEKTGRAFRIEHIAKGYQMLTMPVYNTWLSKVLKLRAETKLTPAALETLAIVAYKQPVLRVDIESIRGVACGEMVNRLREMNLVKIVGRAEELGRPMLYGTTKAFLEVFGLGSLDDLPNADELVPPKQ
jgi:segregation and condensation protein B